MVHLYSRMQRHLNNLFRGPWCMEVRPLDLIGHSQSKDLVYK